MPKPIAAIPPGQEVRIGINPTIQFGEYTFIKPSASVTLTVPAGGIDDIDMVAVRQELKRLVAHATLAEIEVQSAYAEALKEGTAQSLAAYCEEVIK